jgi:hypothetical protein
MVGIVVSPAPGTRSRDGSHFSLKRQTSKNYFLDFSAFGFLIDRKDFCEVDQLKGMF